MFMPAVLGFRGAFGAEAFDHIVGRLGDVAIGEVYRRN